MKGGWTDSSVVQSLSATYKGISGSITSWYRNKKDNYNNNLAKQQVAAAKVKSEIVFSGCFLLKKNRCADFRDRSDDTDSNETICGAIA